MSYNKTEQIFHLSDKHLQIRPFTLGDLNISFFHYYFHYYSKSFYAAYKVKDHLTTVIYTGELGRKILFDKGKEVNKTLYLLNDKGKIIWCSLHNFI